MTNDNYTQDEVQTLTSEIRCLVNSSYHGWHNKIKSRIDLLDFINWKTPLLQDKQYTLATKVYWVLNDIVDFPCCKICHKPFIGSNVCIHNGYQKYCSQKCQWQDQECCKKRDLTVKNRTPEQRKCALDKARATCQKRYGANSWQSSEEGRKHSSFVQQNFSDEKRKLILDKIIRTTNELYGCDNVFQNEKIKDKCRQTKIKKYGDAHYTNSKQRRETMVNRYGVEYTLQSKELQEKSMQIKRELYGDKLEGIVSKVKNTKLEKYGDENYNNSIKQGITSRLNHGGLYHSQTIEFAKYRRKRIFHDNIWFDSNWEIMVYDYCKEHGFEFEYQPSISFDYQYDGKTFTYHPDFIINGKIYEVKGDQFFRVDESGREVMFNPYRDSSWSDLDYENECEKFEAKHQCMIRHGVVILREKQINDLSIVFNNIGIEA